MSNLPGEATNAAVLARCAALFVDFCTIPHKLVWIKD
jgi:hypothetical protein